MHRQRPDQPDDERNQEASRPCLWSVTDRLPSDDVKTIIDLHHAGTTGKDLAARFEISLSSVRRLLRKRGTRHSDRRDEAG